LALAEKIGDDAFIPRFLTIITGLRAGTKEPTLRTGLESSPLVREVEELARGVEP
jgi:hypothetical protein